jgi:hypothetical protein
MTSQPPFGHGDLGPELRRLAQALLDQADPAVRALAALAVARTAEGAGKCQQVWCPVCAIAALAAGEDHPLLAVIAEHSVGVLSVLRAMVDSPDAGSETEPLRPEDPAERPPGGGQYHHIPIVIED